MGRVAQSRALSYHLFPASAFFSPGLSGADHLRHPFFITPLRQFLAVRADVGEGAVLHAEAVRNGSKLGEAKPLVEVPRVDIAFDDGVELEDACLFGM